MSNPASAAIGYHWLVATNSSGCKGTAYINVKLDVQKWIGTVDSNWHHPTNWSGGTVSTDKTHVLIFGGTTYPCVISNGNAVAASIRVLKGGIYRVRNLRQLTVTTSCDTLPAYYEVGPKTILIDNPTSQIIQLVDSSKIIFNGNTPQLQSLDTSNIIISSTAPNAPYGFLRKVKTIQHTGNIYTITTNDVSLETAFKDLYFEYSQLHSSSDTAQQQRTASAGSAEADIPVDLSYSFSAGVNIFGSLTITPKLTMLLYISNSHQIYAKIEGSFQRAVTLGLNVNAVTSLSAEATLYEKMLQPIYIPFELLVLEVVPTLKVKVGLEGSADVAYHASISDTSFVNAFLEYEQSGWHKGWGRTTTMEYNFSGVNGNVNLKPWVEPYIDFKLYNQDWAKGTIKARVYAIGEAHTQPKPSCRLTAGITAGIAANLQMFIVYAVHLLITQNSSKLKRYYMNVLSRR